MVVKKEPHLVIQMELSWAVLWVHCWDSQKGLNWAKQRAGQWGIQKEKSWGSRKGHHLGLLWGQHLVLLRDCQREQSWAILLVDCWGFHWDCCWVTGLGLT